MNLSATLKTHTPIVWVCTDEPARALDEVVACATNAVYRLTSEGLVLWDSQQNRWLRVLTEFNEDELVPIYNPRGAFAYVRDHGGLFILHHGHQMVKDFFLDTLNLVEQFRDSYYTNTMATCAMQMLIMSCESQVPAEIARDTVLVHFDLPDEHEIKKIFKTVQPILNFDRNLRNQFVHAAKGLTEMEIMRAITTNMASSGHVDVDAINQFKIETIAKSGALEVRVPTMGLEDIGGLDRAKELIEAVAWTWHNPKEAKRFNVVPLRRMLMVGVPGTGKSAICEANAKALHLELARTGVSQTMSKWVGESEANMRRVFAQIRALAPICMWIDEFGRDMSGSGSSSDVDGGTTDRVHGEFLTGLQELPENVFLMCAANRIDSLPPEMLRADRFDKIMFVGFPAEPERIDIFRIHLGEHAERYDLELLAAATPTFTGAEIKALLREVFFRTASKHRRFPRTDEIIEAAPLLKGRVWLNHRPAIVSMYQRAVNEWEFASSLQERDAELLLSAASHAQPQPPSPIPSSYNLFSKI